ncbi:MAG: hypothetical protein ACTSYI_16780 [Promethearchaeota archaeon]
MKIHDSFSFIYYFDFDYDDSFIYYFDYDDSCKMELIFVIKTMKNSQSREINQQKLLQFKTAFLERNCKKLRNWDGQIDIFGCSEEILESFQGDETEKLIILSFSYLLNESKE